MYTILYKNANYNANL